MNKALTSISISAAFVYLGLLLPQAAVADDSLQQSWWLKYQKHEDDLNKQTAPTRTSVPDDALRGSVETRSEGSFTIPAWFGVQPKPFERPVEIVRSTPRMDDTTISNGAFAATLPMVIGGGGLPYGAGYTPWYGGGRSPYGYGYGTGYSYGPSAAAPGAFLGLSAAGISPPLGIPGFGFGSGWGGLGTGYGLGGLAAGLSGIASPLGFGGGYGGWGGGYGGWGGGYGGGYGGWGGGYGGYASPGFGALMMGAFARPSDGLGEVTPSRIIQTAPSKASGNYYAPSTQDTTASGSYYASTTPAQMPVIQQPKTIKNFYKEGGTSGPFPSDLNSVPWNK